MNTKRYNKLTGQLFQSFGKLKTDSFNFDLIERYFRKKDNNDSLHVISDRTCNDLDIHELFMFIDRTNSKVGQQYLYNKLRTIPATPDRNTENETLIQQFLENEDFRITVQKNLVKLNKEETLYITALFQEEHLQPPKWFFITKVLSFTSLLSLLLIPFNPAILFVFFGVFLINMGIHLWNKRNIYQYLNSIPQLLKLVNIARQLFKFESLQCLSPDLPKYLNIADKIKNRMAFFKMEAKLEGDLQALFWGLIELFKIIFLLEPILLFGVLKRLDKKRKEMEEIFVFTGKVDSLISVASLRYGLNKRCIPEIVSNKKHLDAKNIYHPLIADCVENSIQLNSKSVLLTGSNMSGKTSFIRTIGINVITGLTINTCFAEYFSMPIMRVYSAVRISDDLMNDKSYYFEEVLTIKSMIDESEKEVPGLFLLDEIFKGTNTIERISAGKAVLSSLNKNNNIVFVSTHDIELADLLKNEFDLYHFSEKVNNKTVDFDYKLKDGKLTNRNAIRILQINNYPKNIIEEAYKISKELDSNSFQVKKNQ